MTTTTNQRAWIGKDIKRHEDPALLMGTATYTNDIKLPGMLQAAVLRSPYPHARIVSIDTGAAKKLPGVYAVLTGREAAEVIDPVPAFCAEPVVEHAIALEKVRYAGEAVVAVAAESRQRPLRSCGSRAFHPPAGQPRPAPSQQFATWDIAS